MSERDELVSDVMSLQFRLMNLSMRQQAGAIAEANLTLPQFRTLVFAHISDRCATSDAAEFLGVKPNVATGVIQRLVEKGLLERGKDPDDARVRLLELTPEGQAFMDDVMGAAREHRRGQLERLSDEQLASLLDVLQTVLAEEPDGPTP